MTLFDLCQDEKIQSRNIDIGTVECDDTHIVVCGELRDRRRVPTYTIAGRLREPAVVHHMRICLKVNTALLKIVEIDAELTAFPHGECAEMGRTLQKIKGLTLSPGFTSMVKKKIGGRNGCIHLTTLLLAMAPAVLQGYWTHSDRRPDRRSLSGDHMERYLLDACHVWRREGPLAREVAEAAGVVLDAKKNNLSQKRI